MPRNLCCSFPHGDAVILPLILSSMGLAATLLTFGLFPLIQKEDLTYGCVEYEINDARSNRCFDLRLNHPTYWDENMVADTNWAAGIQAASVFGIFACALGAVAWGMLVSATCLEIKCRRLTVIRILLGFASFFAFSTITATSADVCDLVAGTAECDRKGFRIGFGCAAMMAAFILYLGAVAATMGFDKASNSGTHQTIEKQESAPLDVENTA